MNDNAPVNKFVMPIHVPQSIGVGYLVLPVIDSGTMPKYSSKGINTTKRFRNVLPLNA